MTPTVRVSLSAVAALFAGVLATFVLVNPTQWQANFAATESQLSRWNDTQSTGVAVGCVLVVVACAVLLRASSTRPAWITAVVATAVLIAARLTVSGVSDLDQLTLLYYAKCLAGGVLLGAAVAAVWSRPIPQLTLVGAVGATFVVAHTAHVGWHPSTSILGEPFWWILIPALVLAAVCVVLDDAVPERIDRETAFGALAAVVTLALAHRLLGEWIDRQTGSQFRQWVVIALCLVLVVALTEFWARRLDAPFLLAATAVAAVTPFVATVLGQDYLWLRPWVPAVVGVVAVAVGVAVSKWLRVPIIAVAVLALVPLSVLIAPAATDNRAWVLVQLAVLGVGIGLALASTLPDSRAVAALGLVVPLLSVVFTAVVGATTSFVIYSGAYEPLPGVPLSTGWTAISPSTTFDRTAAVAMLLVVVFCALAIRGQRRQQSAPLPD
ncbi:hypothetical protein ABEU20_004577 [Rhodococcus sp. PAM 2766]|uniref:Integral membrane protein n=1 Tax=Rhodococcus parequi TaxID=3137122 RepID=A0ABW9FL08_9NOCA